MQAPLGTRVKDKKSMFSERKTFEHVHCTHVPKLRTHIPS